MRSSRWSAAPDADLPSTDKPRSSQTRSLTARRLRAAGAALLGALVLSCSHPDPRFSSPAATYKTYRQALVDTDYALQWACHSPSYHETVEGGQAEWEQSRRQWQAAQIEAETGREIADERLINETIAYLLFDETTVPDPSASPRPCLWRSWV